MFDHETATVGQPVLTADQRRLGRVAELRGPFIRVRRFLRPGFWLSTEYVLWSDSGRIVMAFARRDLSRYRRRHVSDTPEPIRAFAPMSGPVHRRQSAKHAPTYSHGGPK